MLVVAYELEDVAQIELNVAVKLMNDLQLMYVFVLAVSLFLNPEEKDELHQQLLYLLAQIVVLCSRVWYISLEGAAHQILITNYPRNDVSDYLVVGVDQVVTAELELNIYNLSCYFRVLFH